MIPPQESGADRRKLGVTRLDGVSSTLLLPLWARAMETCRPDPILRDDKAVEILKAIEFDFDLFERRAVSSAEFCLRARVFDQLVQSHIRDNPDCTVVELGVGLDTRFDRLDTLQTQWLELDLPEVIQLRQRIISGHDRRRLLEGSLLKDDWFACVSPRSISTLLFIAEGLFYFFQESEIRDVLIRLKNAFPGARLLFDAQSPLHLWYSNMRQPIADARLRFSLKKPTELERWDPHLRVEKWVGFGDRPYYQEVMGRLSWFKRAIGLLHPLTRRLFTVAQIRFDAEPAAVPTKQTWKDSPRNSC